MITLGVFWIAAKYRVTNEGVYWGTVLIDLALVGRTFVSF